MELIPDPGPREEDRLARGRRSQHEPASRARAREACWCGHHKLCLGGGGGLLQELQPLALEVEERRRCTQPAVHVRVCGAGGREAEAQQETERGKRVGGWTAGPGRGRCRGGRRGGSRGGSRGGRREGAERTGELERPREDAAVHAAAVRSALRCGGGTRARVRPAAVEHPSKHLAGLGDEVVARGRSEQRASWWALGLGVGVSGGG